jgi:hypothetical protein
VRVSFFDFSSTMTPALRQKMQLARKKKQAPAKASLLALGNPPLGNRSVALAKFAKMDAELHPLPEAAAQVRALGRFSLRRQARTTKTGCWGCVAKK